MKCFNCGTELREGARFCKSCGIEIKGEEPKISADIRTPMNGADAVRMFKEVRMYLDQIEIEFAKSQEISPEVLNENNALKRELEEKIRLLEQERQETSALRREMSKLQELLSKQSEELENLKLALANAETYAEEEEAVMAECPNCHMPIDEHTIFCGECGTKVR